MDEPLVYSQVCSMKPDQATVVSEMLKNDAQFSKIETIIDINGKTHEVLVTFRIPREGERER